MQIWRQAFYKMTCDTPVVVFLRSCEHCGLDKFNLGLDSLSHLCRCACVQDFADFESFEQSRHDAAYYSKNRIVTPSRMPVVMRNR